MALRTERARQGDMLDLEHPANYGLCNLPETRTRSSRPQPVPSAR